MRKNKQNLVLNNKDQYFAFYKQGDKYEFTINHISREYLVYIIEDIKLKVLSGEIQLQAPIKEEESAEQIIEKIHHEIEQRKKDKERVKDE